MTSTSQKVSGGNLLEAALGYAGQHRWPVVPGTYLVRDHRMLLVCSCGRNDCSAPGTHPANPWWGAQATANPSTIRWWWDSRPHAPIVLPTGGVFDVLDVPETPGYRALERLERLGLWLGPVLSTGDGRMQFLVEPGAVPDVTSLLRELDQDVRPDLECRGEGGFIFAPPSRVGMGRCARWEREPDPTAWHLPKARELLVSIVYACYRPTAGA